MPIKSTPVSIFMFCHQDDEFGVFFRIQHEVARGNRVVCIYATTGVTMGEDPSIRNIESLSVLCKLGVRREDVIFAGSLLGIPDGYLISRVPAFYSWAVDYFSGIDSLASVYVPAWEGGHPDHDALHAAAVKLLMNKSFSGGAYQFSLYNAKDCIWKFFKICFPLEENGPVIRFRIPIISRFRFMYLALCYPSQWKSWIGLYPFFMINLIINGHQKLQLLSDRCVYCRPHAGALYYERRGFASWELFVERITQFFNWSE